MAEHFWVPQEDATLDPWATGRAGIKRARVLSRYANSNSYPPHTPTRGSWQDIHEGDIIFINAHGFEKNLSYVGWATNTGVVKWDAERLANSYFTNLVAAGKQGLFLELHLTACWGANRFTLFTSSFGKKLAGELRRVGARGTLTAYQGAKSLNVYGEYQAGYSRITSGLLHWKNLNVLNSLGLANNRIRNRLGVRVAYKSEEAAVYWLLMA